MQKLPKVTINKLIKNLLDKNKNQTIFFFENKKISRIELLNKILQARNGLLKKGFKNKDKVICLLDNSYEQIALFLACLSLGIVWVPIELKRKGIGLNYIIKLVNPKAIFTSTKKNLENGASNVYQICHPYRYTLKLLLHL